MIFEYLTKENEIQARIPMTEYPKEFHVGDWYIEVNRNLLTSPAGEQIRLAPKAIDVLRLLAYNRGQVVEREQIITQIWKSGGGDDSLNNAISSLRIAFGDNRKSSFFIETVPKRGYRLSAPVELG